MELDLTTRLLQKEAFDMFQETMQKKLELCKKMITDGEENDNNVDALFGRLLYLQFSAAYQAGCQYRLEQAQAQNPEPEIAVAS